jgi:hypothetical protein
MGNVAENVVEKIETPSLFSATIFSTPKILFYDVILKNIVEPCSKQTTTRRLCHAWEISKSTDTLSRNM